MPWQSPYILLGDEFHQRRREGCSIPRALEDQYAALHPSTDAWNHARLDPLYDALMAVPDDPALATQEPNELPAIRALRPDGPRNLHWQPDDDELFDRMYGAWTGRAAGCVLGKPVEGNLGRPDLLPRHAIKQYLQHRDDWPLVDYFSGRDIGDGFTLGCPGSQRERLSYVEDDDDIHYTIAGLAILEAFGTEFTWEHVACFWSSHLPYSWICGAEKQAFDNFVTYTANASLGRGQAIPADSTDATPLFTRRHWNPYRENIGAQIRSAGWAWACAGHPERAAEFAWRDASWTHERNGIYAAMFCAAMHAAAFIIRDATALVLIGLSEIPEQCRLAQAIRQCLAWAECTPDFEACMEQAEARYSDPSSPPVIIETLIVVIAMIYGQMDTLSSTAISVMCGWDTDCNGATVGAIVGAASGYRAFAEHLVVPLHDQVRPQVFGFTEITLTELAERHATVWRTINARAMAEGNMQ